ncbi:hypothetical protein PVAP13_4KG348528 [Panicum virgatum]|uniref:DUF1618 domain-containing protein n=1 Tax=Panicum virgatum TaxID=38727 RepID=A0A8T0TR12_PANVG|nr:hypothetical protein PVAP13_4KG348528 [Panicum virgatum]
MDRRPDWILLNTVAIAGRNSNASTATDRTRHGKTIEVSLSLEHPPHPSILYVHSSDMNLCMPPTVVRTAEDLLISVNMGFGPYSLSPNDCDYFIYQPHTSCPSLQLLQHPHPYFNDNDVGLLHRSDGQYTVAVLVPAATPNQFKLHVFHSHSKIWSCWTLSVEAPQEPFPMKLPTGSAQLHRHSSSGVIIIGGTGGTIGWVDHWRGIIFCDVLRERPSLRELIDADGEDDSFGPGWHRRGVSFIRDKGLRLVHLEVTATRLRDPETGFFFSFKVDSWALITWSNRRMTDSHKDWHRDCTVHASDFTLDNPAVTQGLESSGLLICTTMGLQESICPCGTC